MGKMRIAMNITTSDEDLQRYQGPDDLQSFLDAYALDGLEVLPLADSLEWIPPRMVLGLHLGYYPYWLDFWRGDEKRLIAEFGSLQEAEAYYGGVDRHALIRKFSSQMDLAERIGAKYVVFHVSDVSVSESVCYRFSHTDEEVVSASLELIDAVVGDRSGGCRFLVENLWWPGFTMTRPELTLELLEGIRAPGKGIMLDVGHLIHTNPTIRTGEQAIHYVHEMLDRHGAMCEHIAGVHLHLNLSGEKIMSLMGDPPILSGSYFDRLCAAYGHVMEVDAHRPFEANGLKELIERISPEYLTHEFITRSREEHASFLARQNVALTLQAQG